MPTLVLLIVLALIPTKVLASAFDEQIISEAKYLSYIGDCPCPYNIDKTGQLCGKRSAWCRPGGYSPICALTRISYQIIEECKSNPISITPSATTSDKQIISEALYIGNCPCPYDVDTAGHVCGKRSAWCKPRGASPKCDLTKISEELKEECKSNNK